MREFRQFQQSLRSELEDAFTGDASDQASTHDPGHFIFTGPLDAFVTRLKIATYGGVILAFPVWLWQLWRFITPGLNPREKRYAVPFVVSSIVLFTLGGFVALLTLPEA